MRREEEDAALGSGQGDEGVGNEMDHSASVKIIREVDSICFPQVTRSCDGPFHLEPRL